MNDNELKDSEVPHGRNLSGEQMARLLGEFVNANGKSTYAQVAQEIVTREHRTLQQNIMGFFVAVIEAWATLPEDRYDLRNEATVRLARKIVAGTGDKYDRHLPHI